MSILFIVAAIVLLGVMVMVHEWGHFLAARLTGIPVKEFAIGFGPRLLSWKSKKHDTQFFLRLIPAGGYCMFYGEDETTGVTADDPRNLSRHPVWKRMITIAMGPVMNFVLALAAATVLFLLIGVSKGGEVRVEVGAVNPGGAAEEAGILPGDVIVSVNGKDANIPTEEGSVSAIDLISAYREGDAPLELRVLRAEESLTLNMIPRYSETDARYMIGVTLNSLYIPIYAPATLGEAISEGASYCVRAGGAILSGLKTMVTTGEGFDQSSGPVGIVRMIAEETQKQGWMVYVQLLVLISVNLGLFNLIPIPGLDGSRIVFLIIEAIRRKPAPQKVEAYVHMAGYLMLAGLMLVMTYKDILNIFK